MGSVELSMPSIIRPPSLALVALLATLAPGAVLAQDDGIPDVARPAHAAIRARCPELELVDCCETPAGIVEGAVHGDRATLVRDCSWVGNGGQGTTRDTVVVDLATCHASCSVEEYLDRGSIGVFDAFAMTEPPAPPPEPPGAAFRADDPRMSAVALLLTGDRRLAITERSGLAIGTMVALPALPGRPPATPAVHLTAADLRALGVTPRPRPAGRALPGRVLRGYRVTRALDAPREARAQGEHAIFETRGARCVAIAHSAADTYQWVRCFPSDGRITWLGGDDAIVIGTFVGDVPHGDRSGIETRITFAIELATGRFHELDVPHADRCDEPTRARLSGATLALRSCRPPVRITLADLARALGVP